MDRLEPAVLAALLGPYLLGLLLALLPGRTGSPASHLAALLGGAIGTAVALQTLLFGTAASIALYNVTPFAGIALRLDPLAAFFLLVISLPTVAVSLYAAGYVRAGRATPHGLALAYNGFVAAMVLVVLADSVLAFLIAWEVMSVVSFLLVVHDHTHAETRRAGFIYLVMTHVGTAFLLLAFLALAASNRSFDFAAFRVGAAQLSPLARDAIFLLALVGFGTKAGVIPLHVWLPRAHPAAPSHVSALMSGVMIKTAIYGLLRVGWEFAGPGPLWWGSLVLALGTVSAVLGVLYALTERDLKRLLAYSSVENIGIILLGLGAAFMLASLGLAPVAALALAAALYHTLNHAAFKSLLFLGAGAVQHGAHTRDLEKLGGLIHRMPWTAGLFLAGSAAIAALPPLNGFASEWLTFQSLLQLGHRSGDAVVGVGAAISAGLLALTGGLAVFCFVRAFGIAFLGVPRSAPAGHAHEANRPMRLGMGLLAVLCVALGLAPGAVVGLLAPVTRLLTGNTAVMPANGLTLSAPAGGGIVAPVGLLIVLVLAGTLALLLARLLGGPERTRVSAPWVCGVALEPAMQYSATALSKAIRIIFQALVQPYRSVERQHSLAPYFVASIRYEGGVRPVYERHLYQRAVGALVAVSHGVRQLQSGSLRLYLMYILGALVVALLLTR